MMGVYGMLAVGLAMFCLRYLIPADRWSDRAARISFWSLNLGLAWMCFATLLPLGLLQLYESVNSGYYEARSLDFLTNDTNALIEWIRLPGDIVFIGGGVPVLYLCWLGIRHGPARHLRGGGALHRDHRAGRARRLVSALHPEACSPPPTPASCSPSRSGSTCSRGTRTRGRSAT